MKDRDAEIERNLLEKLGVLDDSHRVDPLLKEAKREFLFKFHQQLNEIQREAIDPIYQGQDAILISSTASGKTEAAVIPIAARILANKNSLCIYIAPTRALLNDLSRRLEAPLHHLQVKMRIKHGDRPLSKEEEDVSFLLTTPESLDVMLYKEYEILKRCRFVVCDEIHQVYGTPRGTQLVSLLNRLESVVTKEDAATGIQRIALSATVGDPSAMKTWFAGGRGEVEVFSVRNPRRIRPEFRWIEGMADLGRELKRTEAEKILIFVNSRRRCDELFLGLKDLDPYRVFIHYSTLGKKQREFVESQFKQSKFAICIATTTMELGIDIGSIEAVVLYEPPMSVTSFLQRIGRGGRRKGDTWVVMTPKTEMELLQFASLSKLAIEGRLENVSPGAQYSVVVQQLFSYIASKHNHVMHEVEVRRLLKPFTWMAPEDESLLLDGLVGKKYLADVPEMNSYRMGSKLRDLDSEGRLFSNITNGGSGIRVVYQGDTIASVNIPTQKVHIGSVLLLAGRYWQITASGKGQIKVNPVSQAKNPVRPHYTSRYVPYLSSEVAQGIPEVFAEDEYLESFDLDYKSKEIIENIRKRFASEEENCVYKCETNEGFVYLTFKGGIENRILELVLSELGYHCWLPKKSEGIAIASDQVLDFGRIPEDREQIERTVKENWNSFKRIVPVGPFHELLGAKLKRKEILSGILYGNAIKTVMDLRDACIVDASILLP